MIFVGDVFFMILRFLLGILGGVLGFPLPFWEKLIAYETCSCWVRCLRTRGLAQEKTSTQLQFANIDGRKNVRIPIL